jgi:hypothetical protein
LKGKEPRTPSILPGRLLTCNNTPRILKVIISPFRQQSSPNEIFFGKVDRFYIATNHTAIFKDRKYQAEIHYSRTSKYEFFFIKKPMSDRPDVGCLSMMLYWFTL